MRITGMGVNVAGDYPPDKIVFQNGFAGMRRREMLDYIKPFVESGKIPPVNENTPRTQLLPMLQLLEGQGSFGPDPWKRLPGENKALAEVAKANEDIEELKAQVARLTEVLVTRTTEPEDEADAGGSPPLTPPPDDATASSSDASAGEPDLAALKRPTPIDLETVGWDELRQLATQAGIKSWGKKREELITLLAPIMERARLEG